MTHETVSVEWADPGAQQAWQRMADSGVGDLAASYVLSTTIVGLARAGVMPRLSTDWRPLAALVPPGGRPDLVQGVFRYLQVRGLLERDDADQWRLTTRGAALLSELPESLLGYYVEAYGPVLDRMAEQLTGSVPYGEGTVRDAEALGRRCEVLFRSFGTTLIADLVVEHGAESVLDLGCGTGGLAIDLCQRLRDLRAVGLDIAPDAVDFGRRRAKAEGLADRVAFVVGDAFQPDQWPPEALACDILTAVGALHEHFRHGEDAVVDLLRRYAQLLSRPGMKALLLAEPQLYVDPRDADFFLVHVLTSQGMPRPAQGWLPVIGAAGLRCARVFTVPDTGFRFAYYEITSPTAD